MSNTTDDAIVALLRCWRFQLTGQGDKRRYITRFR
jgi:hypothetical protein